eukprot:231866-Rhodomonas_salina.3
MAGADGGRRGAGEEEAAAQVREQAAAQHDREHQHAGRARLRWRRRREVSSDPRSRTPFCARESQHALVPEVSNVRVPSLSLPCSIFPFSLSNRACIAALAARGLFAVVDSACA